MPLNADAAEGGIDLVADGLFTAAKAEGNLGNGEVLDTVHVECGFHTYGQAVYRLEKGGLRFAEVDGIEDGVVGPGGRSAELPYMLLVNLFVADNVQEAVAECGAEIGGDGSNGRQLVVCFPEVDKEALDSVLRGGAIFQNAHGIAVQLFPIRIKQCAEGG